MYSFAGLQILFPVVFMRRFSFPCPAVGKKTMFDMFDRWLLFRLFDFWFLAAA
jgi:hypothetical protein